MAMERMALLELIEKRADGDLVRELLAYAAELLMAVEVERLCGAGHGERNPARTNQRNGYHERPWGTRTGRIELKLPKLCPLGDPRIAVSCGHGSMPLASMGMADVSKSEVSRICQELDEWVSAFLGRLIEGEWPYLWIDATYVQVREQGRIIGAAMNTDGRREVLDMTTGPSEAEPFWTDFLRSPTDRGLRGVKLVVADDHKGLRAAGKVLHATL